MYVLYVCVRMGVDGKGAGRVAGKDGDRRSVTDAYPPPGFCG